ncbi:MAG: carbamate kinase [Eubacterium sp.]|nr:carbamate kinase [Eubacterium sp.]
MQKKKVVVALGHRALGTTFPEQQAALETAVKAIADLVEQGANIAITHSNGPQVGMIHTAMNEFYKKHTEYTGAPMSICSAMSQGYIGYDIQNTLRAELLRRGIYKPVATIITQVTVDPYDEALYQPTKVIGRLLTREEADAEEAKGNFVTAVEGGYRRIIAAPKPQEVIELESIQLLLDAGQIVIAGGGGGIPVMEQGAELRGASAVIEKDLVSEKLAEELRADDLVILTSVDNVVIGYNTENPEPIGQITVDEAERYIREGQFEPGTMLPKIEAAVNFIRNGGKRAVITSIAAAKDAYLGTAGTIITA